MQLSRRKLLQFMGVGAGVGAGAGASAAVASVTSASVASVVDKPIAGTPVGPFPTSIIRIGEDWTDYGKYLKRRLENEFELLQIELHDADDVFAFTVRDRHTGTELAAHSMNRHTDSANSKTSAEMARTRHFRSVDRAINELKQQFVAIDIGIDPVGYSGSHYKLNE